MAALAVCSCSKAPQEPSVIPRPVSVEMGPQADEPVIPDNPEGYVLTVTEGMVRIDATDEVGRFYAGQTLAALERQYGKDIPDMRITDWPRFPYRGLHLDVSRHFFDKEVVKKQLRMMASLKMNRFHWHLTDGIGWRLQIDAYPLLTQREHYSKDDVREVLALADSLHITVIPEIEMFGHSEEVIAVYPELKCRVEGASSEFCIGNEKTFEFLETVLDEVIDLFPSQYIHIGGDEANKDIWNACPLCRKRIATEGLPDVDALQSYGIGRIERFVNSRGRTIIGWDEILDGGLAPNAVVMSWRGEEGGRAAAAMGHDVIMTPGEHCYLNFYQDGPDKEPLAMGSYLPLSEVYNYDPAPEDMPGREHVKGLQGNLWTEYVETTDMVEYQLYPRLFAIAENGWSPSGGDYGDFRLRAISRLRQAREDGYCTFDLEGERDGGGICPDTLRHKAYGCPVSYGTDFSPQYAAGGEGALTDGLEGSWDFRSRWQGFLNSDAVFTVDLGKVRRIKEIGIRFGQWYSAWICMPVEVLFEASEDGETFWRLGAEANTADLKDPQPQLHRFSWKGREKVRFIRITARINDDKWGWLFTDEIIVN